MNSQGQLMNDKQVADYLGVAVGTVRDWRYKGKGPEYIRISHRCVRYKPEDIRKWEDDRRYESTSQEAMEA